MTDQLRTLAEAAAEGYATSPHYPEYWAFVDGFIAGRTNAADEIEAERLDTDWEALGADAYINGLIKSEEIARKGRDV
jgi:hypothetical protein